MADFSAKRISDEDEWRIIRLAFAETYPVRLLLNHVDELAAALRALQTEIASRFGDDRDMGQDLYAVMAGASRALANVDSQSDRGAE